MPIHKHECLITITDVPLRMIGPELVQMLGERHAEPGDRVIYRDETGLWHEMVLDHARGDIAGIRIIGALNKQDAIDRLGKNQHERVSKWPLESWADYIDKHVG